MIRAEEGLLCSQNYRVETTGHRSGMHQRVTMAVMRDAWKPFTGPECGAKKEQKQIKLSNHHSLVVGEYALGETRTRNIQIKSLTL
jgi:hypothetical protein